MFVCVAATGFWLVDILAPRVPRPRPGQLQPNDCAREIYTSPSALPECWQLGRFPFNIGLNHRQFCSRKWNDKPSPYSPFMVCQVGWVAVLCLSFRLRAMLFNRLSCDLSGPVPLRSQTCLLLFLRNSSCRMPISRLRVGKLLIIS